MMAGRLGRTGSERVERVGEPREPGPRALSQESLPFMTEHADPPPESPPPLARYWQLDPAVIFLNHGSYGACPRSVLQAQQRWRDHIERDPVHFFKRELEGALDVALQELARFLGADAARLAFVPNTTTGVNAVLRSLNLKPGDELVTTTHVYNACGNALDFVAGRADAQVIRAHVPFPLASSEHVLDRICQALTARTRLVLVDHITSSTGIIFPIARLVRELNARGVESLVDGAHAPGMVEVDLEELGATYYVGNCHKWLCAPKGSAFLYVSPSRLSDVRPVTISHGANAPRTDRTRFRLEFDWTGTDDVTAYLAVPDAIRDVGALVPGGWPSVRDRNHSLALRARQLVCRALGLDPPCPDHLVGSIAAIPLPDAKTYEQGLSWSDPLQDALYERFRIEVPVMFWPSPPQRLVRVSAHLYNDESQYRRLARALTEVLSC